MDHFHLSGLNVCFNGINNLQFILDEITGSDMNMLKRAV